jgi:hypothetical protein
MARQAKTIIRKHASKALAVVAGLVAVLVLSLALAGSGTALASTPKPITGGVHARETPCTDPIGDCFRPPIPFPHPAI